MTSPNPVPTVTPNGTGRLVALDALRGFDMCCLLLFGRVIRAVSDRFPDQPIIQALGKQFTHPDWVGFTFYDLIFPLFEFLIGMSVWLSVSNRLARGDTRTEVLRHAVWRAMALVALGFCVNGNLLTYDPTKFRLTYSVLQMLAVASLSATACVLWLRLRGQLLAWPLLLIGYWALLTYVPLPAETREYVNWMGHPIVAPAHQVGVYLEGAHVNYWFDDLIFGAWDRWKVGWILESLGHAATALLGVLAARWITSSRSPATKVLGLVAAGGVSLAVGWVWSWQFPIIKNLWTSSFVLWAGGWSLLLLAGFYGVIDGLGWRSWADPLIVVGSNSIVAYLLATVFAGVLGDLTWTLVGGSERLLGANHGLVVAVLHGILAWLILWHLHRQRIFLRI